MKKILTNQKTRTAIVTYGIVTPSCDVQRLSQVFIIREFEITE